MPPRATLDSLLSMHTLILYYSRSGTTRTLAEALANALDADLAEITCPRYKGLFGYLRAGHNSLKGKIPPIEMPDLHPADYDLVLLGAPIWTSYPAVPLRAFLANKPALPERVGLFFTYGGHSPAEAATTMTQDLLGKPPEDILAIEAKDIESGAFLEAVNDFAEKRRKTAS